MSSKKFDISNKVAIRICELMEYFAFNKRRQGKFAKMIGVSPSFLSEVVNLKSGPSFNLLFGIAKEFPGINLNWLLTGEGEMIRGDKKGSLYNKVDDEDPEIADLLSRTVEILKSETDYSFSLSANIRSFHHAIRMEKEVSELKSEVSYIKRTMNSKIAALEEHRKSSGKIRKEDPPGKKEEFIKKRAM